MSDIGASNSNSPYAWRETGGRNPPKRPVSERVADFLEIYGLFDEASARAQAARCVQCPNPSCVTGCPSRNPIPQWMALTAEGRFLEAASVLGAATNMPEICSRICPSDRLCEATCLLDSVSTPVPIHALEQFLVEYAFSRSRPDTATAPPNGLKVAVAGSGPGCLACAEELARRGYSVTILDSAIVPGGLLVDGMPAFKLDQSLVQRRIDLLRQRGVTFRLGVGLWDVVTLGDLQSEYDAVFLGFDARQARQLHCTGEDLLGVVQAIPFLLHKTASLSPAMRNLDVAGKRVAVLGGGDTALDCLRAAIRYGAREATGIYRRDPADMPCSRREYQNAVEEGARFKFRTAPLVVLGNGSEVSGLRLIQTRLGAADATGRHAFATVPDSEFELPVDCVVLALGFDPVPCPRAADFRSLTLNSWGGIVVDDSQMTSRPGVFAGGDIVRGPCLAVEAVRDGRKAAEQIHRFLFQKREAVAL